MKNSLLKIFIFIATLAFSSSVWGISSTASKETLHDNYDGDNHVTTWNEDHVTFAYSGGSLYTALGFLYMPHNATYQLRWTVAEGYTIKVTKVAVDVERASGTGYKMTVGNGSQSSNLFYSWNIPDGGIASGSMSCGNNDAVAVTVCKAGTWSTCAVKSIKVTYTLKPNFSTANGNVEVTICDENKKLVDLTGLSHPVDAAHVTSHSYKVLSASGASIADAHITADNKFYATKVGTYTVRDTTGYAGCHNANYADFTITVNPATLTLTAPTASDIRKGQGLSASVLSGGSATISGCGAVEGTWAWKYPTTTPEMGDNQPFAVVFTPSANPSNYTNKETTAYVDVKRAQFIFDGSGSEEDDPEHITWCYDDNWKDNVQADSEDEVLIQHDVVIRQEVSAYSVTIAEGKSLTIMPTGGLTVGAGGISGATKDNFVLKAETEGATKGKTGYLRISPDYTGAMPEATVELYSKAYYDYDDKTDNIAKWQYVGSPLARTDIMAKTVYTTSWIYSWNESADKWFNERKTLKFTPFVGYATTQRTYPDGILLSYTGQLVSNQGKHDLDLAWSGEDHGYNAIANSFAAPIDITKFSDEDFFHADSVVYLFNTGSRSQAMAAAAQKSPSVNTPGQFLAIPVGSIRMLKKAFDEMPTTIASMQGFFVHALAEDARVTMEYDKLVWNGDYGENPNVPIRAPKQRNDVGDEEVDALQISVFSEMGADHLFMLESERFNSMFENGLDARKLMGDALNIFSVAGNDQLAVDATNSIIGTRVGIRTGEETAYTLAFNNLRTDIELALLDNETEQTIDIENGVEYTFFAEPNTIIADRFMIVERDNADKPGVTTDIEQTAEVSKVHKFIQNGKLFILKNGVLYDAMGKAVR